jgi:hypothetical protein
MLKSRLLRSRRLFLFGACEYVIVDFDVVDSQAPHASLLESGADEIRQLPSAMAHPNGRMTSAHRQLGVIETSFENRVFELAVELAIPQH